MASCVGVKVDDLHHVFDRLGSGLEHGAEQQTVLEAGTKVPNDAKVFNVSQPVAVVEKAVEVLAENFVLPLTDLAEIFRVSRSGVSSLIVLGKGSGELTPSVDAASWEVLEP